MSLFNEEDVVEETVQKLINSDIEIYILDNGCTDSTISRIQKYVGSGIIDIIKFTSVENGRQVFKLSDILEQFELAAKKLPHEWFMISDADEIKYSPWQHLSLGEGIARVDRLGYNLLNFKLFDFRPIGATPVSTGIETGLEYYSNPGSSSAIQMKCWKRNESLDIKSFGGHIILVPNSLVFPVRFINKHYPIRSAEHGMRKLRYERQARYSVAELEKGWHTHYSAMDPNDAQTLVWQKEDLTHFDITSERLKLFEEATELLMDAGLQYAVQPKEKLESMLVDFAQRKNICPGERAKEMFEIGRKIFDLSTRFKLPPIEVASSDARLVSMTVSSLRSQAYLNGDLLSFQNSGGVQLVSSPADASL